MCPFLLAPCPECYLVLTTGSEDVAESFALDFDGRFQETQVALTVWWVSEGVEHFHASASKEHSTMVREGVVGELSMVHSHAALPNSSEGQRRQCHLHHCIVAAKSSAACPLQYCIDHLVVR